MALLDSEEVEVAFSQWVTGQATQMQLADEYGVSQQTLQFRLKRFARAHMNEVIASMWAFHKEHGTPFPIRIPRSEAFHENAAFHYGQWLLNQFKRLDMHDVIVRPFLDPESGDVVFGLLDQDFMRQLDKGDKS